MIKLLKKLKNSKRGFSLVELIVVIAIMAVIAAVLVPSLLMHVEESRAEKDIKTTDEVVTAVELALADQDVYDELVEHSVFDNVSCYVDKDSESGYEKTVIKETYNGNAEQYMFGDDARQNDEVPYYGAGNMRGLTVTFSPEKDSNESTYELSRGIINRFVGRKTGYLYENEKLYNAIRSVVGDKIYNSSQTYRNSDFTIFIRLGSAGGNEAGNQDATQVWGQYNGTNLPADAVQTAKITTDRAIGDAGQYDQAVNDYINDEANTDIDFSQLAQMGNSNFGKELESNSGNVIPTGGVYTTLDGTVYSAGDKFPEKMEIGEYYVYGDYKYTVNGFTSRDSAIEYLKKNFGLTNEQLEEAGDEEIDGLFKFLGIDIGKIWQVNVVDKSKTKYEDILETVNGYPMVSLNNTYKDCVNLLQAPKIPTTIINMNGTFRNCVSLVDISNVIIPEGVYNMTRTFYGCKNLTGTLVVNTTYRLCPGTSCDCTLTDKYCLQGVENEIEVIGSAPEYTIRTIKDTRIDY